MADSDISQDALKQVDLLNFIGFLEGFLYALQLVPKDELEAAIQRGIKRYEEMKRLHE